MPRLTPTDLVLSEKILAVGTNAEPQVLVRADLDILLRKHRLTSDDALETLSEIMKFSKKEQHKITVAKLALEMNGVFVPIPEPVVEEVVIEEEKDKTPVIQFVFNDSNVNLNGIFSPQRREMKQNYIDISNAIEREN